MNVETMIYAYLAVCTSMIIFNCVCVWVFHRRSKALERSVSRLRDAITAQIQRICAGQPVEEKHIKLLRKKLAYSNGLMAFDETLERLLEQMPEDVLAYVQEVRSVFTYLTMENRYHDTMKWGYFAYVIRKYNIIKAKPVPLIMQQMIELLEEPSLYCRENALEAIYSAEDCGYVLKALHKVDDSELFHHAKLLTDGLLNFGGNRRELAQELWNSFGDFSVAMQVVILDFIRFGGVDRKEDLLMLLADSRSDDEIRFSCIRYFGKYPFDRAYPLLIEFVERSGEQRWEYAAIAASSLASYPGQRTVDVLKKALSSSVWYIRFNAAKSLEHFNLTYLELSDVMESNDRYAREIMQYQINLNKAVREREVALV